MKAELYIRFDSMDHAYNEYMDYCGHEGISLMGIDEFKENCIAAVKVYMSCILRMLDSLEISYDNPKDYDEYWDYVIYLNSDTDNILSILDNVSSEIFSHSSDNKIHYTFRSFYDFSLAHDKNTLFSIKPKLLELDIEQYE